MLLNWSITTEKCYYYFIAIFIVLILDWLIFLNFWYDELMTRLKNDWKIIFRDKKYIFNQSNDEVTIFSNCLPKHSNCPCFIYIGN